MSEPKPANARLTKQDWPNFRQWERGGPFVDEQLAALTKAISGGEPERPTQCLDLLCVQCSVH